MGEKLDVTDFHQNFVLGPKFNADSQNRFKFGVKHFFFFEIREKWTKNMEFRLFIRVIQL